MRWPLRQERYDILLNREGGWLLDGIVHFAKAPTVNCIATTRVEHGHAGWPVIVATMMRPGHQHSINCDDLHFAHGHTNDVEWVGD